MNLALFYDTETQGLPLFKEPSEHPSQPHIVQLAACLLDLDTRKTIAGMDVINPAELNPDLDASWHECMRVDIAALVTCTAIHLLPGWQCSKGATLALPFWAVETALEDAYLAGEASFSPGFGWMAREPALRANDVNDAAQGPVV